MQRLSEQALVSNCCDIDSAGIALLNVSGALHIGSLQRPDDIIYDVRL